jgi:hypothetical protein
MAQGFSLVEAVIAMGIALAVAGAAAAFVEPARARFAAELESEDVHQRLQSGSDSLYRDLADAGAGAYAGSGAGPLIQSFAPVLPGWPDAGDDGFAPGFLTLTYVPATAAQTTIAQPLEARSGVVQIHLDPGCPVGDLACGFEIGDTVLVYDWTGARDRFAVDAVAGSLLSLDHLSPDGPTVYPAGSKIVLIVERSYFLDRDASTGVGRLMRQESGPAEPIVDHVVSMSFEFDGDPNPPTLVDPTLDRAAPWARSTTYGPGPPPAGVAWTEYPPGENCTFAANADGSPTPRLDALVGEAGGLVRLEPSRLVDGPWCPDPGSASRFDADLLRVRSVVVTLRVESADDTLRGPAGVLFSRGGTATTATGLVPDQTLQFVVSPRNLVARGSL